MEKEITVIEAFDLIQSGKYMELIDLRSPEAFAGKSIKGFRNIPAPELSQKVTAIDGKKHILLLCENGKQSHQALAILEACEFHPQVIRGGIQDWEKIIGLD